MISDAQITIPQQSTFLTYYFKNNQKKTIFKVNIYTRDH